jgi:hypothetical protein
MDTFVQFTSPVNGVRHARRQSLFDILVDFRLQHATLRCYALVAVGFVAARFIHHRGEK